MIESVSEIDQTDKQEHSASKLIKANAGPNLAQSKRDSNLLIDKSMEQIEENSNLSADIEQAHK